jgi:TetR/AcrR family acrAB operon transcriptional repressor
MFVMRRTAEATEITRKEILASAVDSFGVSGYGATRLEDIAQRAGVTRGAVYHHFGSKRGVLGALVATYAGGFDRLIEEILDDYQHGRMGDAASLVEALMVGPLATIDSDPRVASFFELALLRMGGTPELSEIRAARRRNVVTHLSEVGEAVARAASGSLGMTPVEFGRLFVGVQQGVLVTWLELGREYSLTGAARRAAETLIAGVERSRRAANGGTE